jgi:hypothetical protein
LIAKLKENMLLKISIKFFASITSLLISAVLGFFLTMIYDPYEKEKFISGKDGSTGPAFTYYLFVCGIIYLIFLYIIWFAIDRKKMKYTKYR